MTLRGECLVFLLTAATAGPLMTTGCVGEQASATSRVHPTADGLFRPPTPNSTIKFGDGRSKTFSRPREVTIGARTGSTDEVIGRAVAAVAFHDEILVLDDRFNVVRVYDDRGTPKQVVGGPGEGPREFQMPVAMTRWGDTRVLVADGANVRLTELQRTPEGAWNIARTYGLPAPPIDVCTIDGRVFVHALVLKPRDPAAREIPSFSSTVIHEINLQTGEARGVVDMYETDNAIVAANVSQGVIECVETTDGGLILYAPTALPEVHAYRPDGTLVWWTAIEGTTALEIVEDMVDRSVAQRRPAGAQISHGIFGLVASNSVVFVQVGEMTQTAARERRRWEFLHTLVLDLEHGEGNYLGTTKEHLLDVANGTVVTATELPYPSVGIRSAEPVRGGVAR